MSSNIDKRLIDAVLNHDVRLVKLLIASGADVNVREDFQGDSLLHLLRKEYHENSIEIMKILLNAGADPNSLNFKGNTPLQDALFSNYSNDQIEYLIRRGADVNVRDRHDETPLHKMAHIMQSFEVDGENLVGLAEVLVKNKADVNAQNVEDCTPLHFATSSAKLVEVLLKHKADVNVKNRFGETALISVAHASGSLEVMQMLVSHGADVNATSNGGLTALHMACLQKNKKMIKFLIRNGANINKTDCFGHTCLMTMFKYTRVVNGKDDFFQERNLAYDTVRFLLSKSYDVNALDSRGKNILNMDPHEDYRHVVMEHLAKMEMLNQSIHPSLLHTIYERNDLSAYFGWCKNELLLAKNTRIPNTSITCFDILVSDKAKLANYATKNNMIENFFKINFGKIFPIYGTTMKKNLEKGIKRQNFYGKTIKS